MTSKRLLTILSFINEKDLIVDVGCDHAYLSKLLEKRGQKSIACDIVPEIINKRKSENSKLINYYVSDGLKDIKEKYDYPILSGMGTFTILNIIKSSVVNYNKCIISSNSDNDILRKEMVKLGFKITKEQIIKEKGKYYNIILFEIGKCNYTEKEYYIGVNHVDLDMLKEKNTYLLNKYNNLLKNIPLSKQKELLKQIKYLINSEA